MTDLDDEALSRIARDEEHLAALRALDIRSALVVPLRARGRTIGAMTFAFSSSGRRHTEGDLAVAEDLGRRAGLAVENVRLYEAQREIALTLQRSLLPASLPAVAGLDLGARYVAAVEWTEAGGDWYEAIAVPSGEVGLLVGDVVGHGVHAAAVMGQLRAAARAYALEGMAPAELLTRLSRYADEVEGALAATAAYVLLDPVTGRGRFACAGHPPPLVLPAAGPGAFADEAVRGAVLGMVEGTCPEAALEVEPGGTLVLYSDGAVEQRDRPIDAGMRSLREASEAARDAGAGADALCARILERLFAGAPPDDDVVLLAARRTG
jgi:serine phosphatase RsbU (regulator of sigma subunit)